jgi:hypothetical protein
MHFVNDVVFHVRMGFGGVMPNHVKDAAEWQSLITFVACEYLTRHVAYESWAIIGVQPTTMAQLVRMITAELGRRE